MKRFIYEFIPVKINISDNMADNVGAYANKYRVVVRPKYIEQNDEGIIQHEMVHVRQFCRPIFGSILLSIPFAFIPFGWVFIPFFLILGYNFHTFLCTSNKFREKYVLRCEVEAYKKQLKYYLDDRSELFVEFISTGYGLDISQEEAVKLLKN